MTANSRISRSENISAVKIYSSVAGSFQAPAGSPVESFLLVPLLDKGSTFGTFALLDKPGVLARVAQALGAHGISIASVLQKESRSGEHVPVIVVSAVDQIESVARCLELGA